ncbi:alpha/beta hydrolase [Pendulispora brunnea]|uniref:Alpha/beta hydrolase n=1 Tax=Pendulispora brunnea TaxID=2905690 RepID=A0ABZ2JV47_9BACT
MRRAWASLFLAGVCLACAGASSNSASGPSVTEAAGERADRLRFGGGFLTMPDGVSVWYRVSGPPRAPTLLFLHGGPGYNSLAFEQSAGKELESRYRVVYVDQRGCGRSGFDGPDSNYGMTKTVEDIDRIREAVGAPKIVVIGHSFGGLVAAEYAHRFPARTSAIVMADTTPDIGAALRQQVAYTESIAESDFPEHAQAIHRIVRGEGTPIQKVQELYGTIGRNPLQGKLHFASADVQKRMNAIDDDSHLLNMTSPKAIKPYIEAGYVNGSLPQVRAPFGAPSLLIAGRASHVIGEANIREAARAWGCELVWLDAGHFVYFESPREFVDTMTRFLHDHAI